MGDKRRNSSLFPISWESGNRVLWDGVREIGVQWAGRCDCDRYYSYLHPLDFDSIFFFAAKHVRLTRYGIECLVPLRRAGMGSIWSPYRLRS